MDLSNRLVDFAAQILIMTSQIQSGLPQPLKQQIVKSSSSPGANYEEALAAGSRKDFHHKCKIALREIRETNYWLRVIQKAGFKHPRMDTLLIESLELTKIFVTICKKTDPRFSAQKK